ncbi:hypothetical protein MKX07_001449 [Trichoderma sp. CBMAI-0711]|uniref:SSCRP protein n=1 Tax=Trichoderma parareesei TaxID=858221 RepID=A0A2H2ZNI7_TRIPA|nr:hypothetical protein MKX07_001449 [Trichoderma sp. CBMAI-0711]OTA04730.1 SSCRP protein [Trichoderma parareesei]
MFAPLLLVLLLVLGRMALAEPTVGAALLGWPPARPFNYYTERLAPCGSPLGAGERLELPTKNAHVAFFAERDVGLNLAISYSQDPTSQDDFESLKYALPPGHINLVSGITCVILGSPISGAAHGRNATLQFKYLSNYDSPEEYRYRYSCADVTFSDTADSYNGDICRNKTRPVAYDRLYGPFLGPEDEEHDEEQPPPPDRGNYVEVEVERPPFPGWAIALIAVGASFFCSIVYLVIYKVCIVPWKRRKPAQTTRWVPPPV